MSILLVLIVLAGVLGAGAIGFGIYRGKKAETDQAWHRAANQLGLEFLPGRMLRSRCIGGYLGGHRVRVNTFSKGSGSNSSTHTRYRVYYPKRLGLGLKLTRQKFMNRMATLFGAQDIAVGDRLFDDDVIVKGDNESQVRKFLTAERREVILEMFGIFKDLVIGDDCVSFEPQGTVNVVEVIVSNLRDLEKAVSRLDPSSSALPPNKHLVDPRHVELLEIPEPDLEQHPVEIEIPERQYPASTPRPTPVREVREAREVAEIQGATAVATMGLEVAAVCQTLFASERSSNETQRRFESYKGRMVGWSGVLQEARPYSIDLVFGGDPGTRAVLVIHEFSKAFGNEAQAIVRFPLEVADTLLLRIGQRIHFEGRLFSCDGMARTLFVTDGALV